MGLGKIDAGHLLEAVRDIAYIVEPSGRILACAAGAWHRFANANGAPQFSDPSKVVGTLLYEAITGEETRDSYRHYAELLLERKREAVSFPYRCDAPEVRRDMRMTISPIVVKGQVVALLYQSQVLLEQSRPAMNIFRAPLAATGVGGLPVVAMCSYCRNVRFPAGEPMGEWIPPERYYQRSGSENVALSHSLCPACYENIVQPALAELRQRVPAGRRR
jgi:hypothetical protein